MNEVSLKLAIDKKGTMDMEIDGDPADIITGLLMAMIDEPDIYQLFNIACKSYEDYKRDNISN